MNIARGADRFIQCFTQANNCAVKFSQLFHILCNRCFSGTLRTEHKGIVAKRLDLQEIVERCNLFQILLLLSGNDCLEQFARLAGRTNDQTFPQFHQQRLWNAGCFFEILQVGLGNQLIQVPKSSLILGQKNNVIGFSGEYHTF